MAQGQRIHRAKDVRDGLSRQETGKGPHMNGISAAPAVSRQAARPARQSFSAAQEALTVPMHGIDDVDAG